MEEKKEDGRKEEGESISRRGDGLTLGHE